MVERTKIHRRKPDDGITRSGYNGMLAQMTNRRYFEQNPNSVAILRRVADLGDSTAPIIKLLGRHRKYAESKMGLPGVTVVWSRLVREAISSGKITGTSRDFLSDYSDKKLRTTIRAIIDGIVVYSSGNKHFVAYTFDRKTEDLLVSQHQELANTGLGLAGDKNGYEPHITVAKTNSEESAILLATRLSGLLLPTTVILGSAIVFPDIRSAN